MQLRYWTVDGAVYAQPLYVPDLVLNGNIVNLVYAATEHASVYAFNSGETRLARLRNIVELRLISQLSKPSVLQKTVSDERVFPQHIFVAPCCKRLQTSHLNLADFCVSRDFSSK